MVKVGERQNKWAKIEAKPNFGFIQIAKAEFVIVKTTQSKTQVKLVLKTTTIIEMATLKNKSKFQKIKNIFFKFKKNTKKPLNFTPKLSKDTIFAIPNMFDKHWEHLPTSYAIILSLSLSLSLSLYFSCKKFIAKSHFYSNHRFNTTMSKRDYKMK
jgi:hypothetical protein